MLTAGTSLELLILAHVFRMINARMICALLEPARRMLLNYLPVYHAQDQSNAEDPSPPETMHRLASVPHSWGSGTGCQYLESRLERRARCARHFGAERHHVGFQGPDVGVKALGSGPN